MAGVDVGRLFVATWKWGDKYCHGYVDRLVAGVRRHLKQEHRFIVCRPEAGDEHLTQVPGCFARLRMFDSEWQRRQGIEPGDRIVCLDLDLVVTGGLDPLFDRREPFVILQGANGVNPCPYNGSVWMLRAGYRPDVWSSFSIEAAAKTPSWEFPDDQGWFWHKMPGAAGWKSGGKSGVYAFQCRGWPGGELLPTLARIVAFPGRRDPSEYLHLKWVREHWQ